MHHGRLIVSLTTCSRTASHCRVLGAALLQPNPGSCGTGFTKHFAVIAVNQTERCCTEDHAQCQPTGIQRQVLSCRPERSCIRHMVEEPWTAGPRRVRWLLLQATTPAAPVIALPALLIGTDSLLRSCSCHCGPVAYMLATSTETDARSRRRGETILYAEAVRHYAAR
jgi:hypothetical protein